MRQNGESSQNILSTEGIPLDVTNQILQTFFEFDLKVQIRWVYELNPNMVITSLFIWSNRDSCWVINNSEKGLTETINIIQVDKTALTNILLAGQKNFQWA